MNKFGLKQKITSPISYVVLTCCVILFVATTVPAKIVFQSNRGGNSEIYVMNDDGSHLRRLTNNLLSDTNPRWSPDGKQIAFSRDIRSTKGQQIELFIMNADGSSQQNLTNHPALDGSKAWAPDGRSIAFASARDGDLSLHLIDLESRTIERLTPRHKNGGGFAGPDWAPDGRSIAYEHSGGAIWKNIHTMAADGGNQKPLPAGHRIVAAFYIMNRSTRLSWSNVMPIDRFAKLVLFRVNWSFSTRGLTIGG